MLPTPTTFPLPCSFALYEEDGQTLAVHILATEGDDGLVAVSVQGRYGASANKSVPLAELKDATPLTTAELIGYEGRGNADSRRAAELRDRYTRAKLLAELLERVPARHFPAAAAALRERRVA
jgi:hypothetical protein